MKIPIYQVDAFTDHLFGGNPAAVCPLDTWLPDPLMQQVAMENNLAETAFFVKHEKGFHIRWFTPTVEVDLCGHATLATAFVLFELLGFPGDTIDFTSRSGLLTVKRNKEGFTLDFPSDAVTSCTLPEVAVDSFGSQPVGSFKGKTDYMFLFESQQQIEAMHPDLGLLSTLECRGVIVTAKGDKTDFVSRFFGPQSGVPEDPVTGSAHTTLAPFWADRLEKKELTAIQLSPRRGHLWCRVQGERVEITGNARLYMTGEINCGD
jgi:PhzF family phenazine biosynthesis protein